MSPAYENELFNLADFDSIQLRIYFKNLTLDKSVSDISKISILEIGDASLTLSLPLNIVASDNHVQFRIYWYDCDLDEEEELFHSTGRILDFEDSGEAMARTELKLVQYDKKSWTDFLHLFMNRQEEISKFFEAGKR